MCRWAAWSGAPCYLEDMISAPEHSLIDQSRHSTSYKTPVNADGFGVAWYGARSEPCVFKDVRPAWSDPNLNQLSHHIKARIFLAHVRASTGTATTYNNCHPFCYENWSFMHNGQMGGYDKLRKTVDHMVPEEFYPSRRGATDSEAMFLLALHQGLATRPIEAMEETVAMFEEMARQANALPYMRFATCWSDGKRLFAARYASDHLAPSVFYRKCENGYMIVSEPLDDVSGNWQSLESQSVLVIEDGQATIIPFGPAVARGDAA